MAKKEKPRKVANGKFVYRGYTLRCKGSYVADSVEWQAENQETERVEHTAGTLHELVQVIDNQLTQKQ